MKKTILALMLSGACVWGLTFIHAGHVWAQEAAVKNAAAEDPANATGDTPKNPTPLQVREEEIRTALKDKIKVIKVEDEQKIAEFALRKISNLPNPGARMGHYPRLNEILAIKDEAARMAALRSFARNPNDPAVSDKDKAGQQDDAAAQEEANLRQQQQSCTSGGGSWSYMTKTCSNPVIAARNNTNNTNNRGSSGGQSGGGGSGSGGGMGSMGGMGGSGFGGGGFGNSGGYSGNQSFAGGEGLVMEQSKESQCGPGGATKLPAGTTPEDRAKICRDAANGMMSSLTKLCKPDELKKPVAERSKDKTGDTSCHDMSKQIEDAFKEAAGLSDSKAQREEICKEAEKEFQSRTTSWSECKPPEKNCLAKARERIAKELENPQLYEFLLGQMDKEVGEACYPDGARVAYVEAVMNRAISRIGTYSRYTSFESTIKDARYYPSVSLNPSRITGQKRSDYDRIVQQVLKGSNTCNYCTGNGSLGVGVGSKKAYFPSKCGGESFGIEKPDAGWTKKLEQICKQTPQ